MAQELILSLLPPPSVVYVNGDRKVQGVIRLAPAPGQEREQPRGSTVKPALRAADKENTAAGRRIDLFA